LLYWLIRFLKLCICAYYCIFCQFAFGVIPNVRAKGVASTKAAELLNNMQLEDPVNMDDVRPTDVLLLWLEVSKFIWTWLVPSFFLCGVLDGDSWDKHCYSARQRGTYSIIFYLHCDFHFRKQSFSASCLLFWPCVSL
jgi:hypothetical protein